MLQILIFILIGIFVGWVASMIMNRHHGLIINLVIGVVGSLIGHYLFAALNLSLPLPALWADLAVSIIGAVILLFILGLFRRRA